MKRRPYDKYFDHTLRGYIVRMAIKNHWRVAAYIGLDDLVQEGFVAFAITKARYADKVENKAHFMALFKRVYFSTIVKLANARSNSVDEVCFCDLVADSDHEYELESVLGEIEGDAEMIASLRKAPAPVKALLEFLQAQTEPPRLQEGNKRETNNQFWNRVLGFDGVDFEAEFRAVLLA